MSKTTKHHAAIGSDGARLVVWGLGNSPKSALADALNQDDVPTELEVIECAAEIAACIESGAIDAEGLGLTAGLSKTTIAELQAASAFQDAPHGGRANGPAEAPLFDYSGPPAEGALRVTIDVPLEFLRDQYTSGVDGGIRYWCESATTAQVIVNRDCEKGSKKTRTHRLDWERAVRLALAKYPRILDPNNMDAETGDMWIQLAAFGEIVYG